jgi:transcriptional repressor of cell division inhibition gene dicB
MKYEDAVSYFGSKTKMARALGVSAAAVSHWEARGIPYDRQCQIQVESKNKVKAVKAKKSGGENERV